jgi:hypothetical protein
MNFPADTLTEPTTEPSSGFTSVILAQLNCAVLRSKIITNQLEATIAALSAGLISPEMAMLMLAETGVEVSS